MSQPVTPCCKCRATWGGVFIEHEGRTYCAPCFLVRGALIEPKPAKREWRP